MMQLQILQDLEWLGLKKTRSITMIALFTIFELEQLSDNQLDHLHHILSRLLIATEPNSPGNPP